MTWRDGEIADIAIKPINVFHDQRGWLSEIFRSDELPASIIPAMAYISVTRPGMARGPHVHVKQTDIFCFMGPGGLEIRMWDNRSESATYGIRQTLTASGTNRFILILPPGIVHGYRNISQEDSMIINCPNMLYAGRGRKEMIDEIRYENMENPPFDMGK